MTTAGSTGFLLIAVLCVGINMLMWVMTERERILQTPALLVATMLVSCTAGYALWLAVHRLGVPVLGVPAL